MPDTPDQMRDDDVSLGNIFSTARAIFRERNSKYKGAFRVGGVVDNAFQLRHKAIRMLQKAQDWERYLQDPEGYVLGYGAKPERPRLDDAYDLINYCCFLIICINEDRWENGMEMTPDETAAKNHLDRWIEAHPEVKGDRGDSDQGS